MKRSILILMAAICCLLTGDSAMDVADIAQDFEQRHLETALKVQKQGVLTEKDSASECVECGYQIPSARQVAVPGVDTCIDCAELLECAGDRARGR